MYISVDRIIGKTAVCESEDLNTFDIPLSSLPYGVKEGSVLLKNSDGSYLLASDEEKRRKQRIMDIQDALFDE